MLPEMVSSKELFALITLPKLVDVVQVLDALIPIRRIVKLNPAIAARVSLRRRRELSVRSVCQIG